MNFNNESINIAVKAENGELVIRHGEALPLLSRRREKLKCTLSGVYEWIDKRKNLDDINHANSLITFDAHKGTIDYIEFVYDQDTHHVTGQISLNPDLESFQINSGKYESPNSLADRLRSLAHCFTTRSEVMKLVSTLKNFEAKVNRDIRESSDDRGNAARTKSQIVETNLPDNFKIYLPVIKGGESISIEVEIYANESLEVTLFSYDLTEKISSSKAEMVATEIHSIRQTFPGIPTIEI